MQGITQKSTAGEARAPTRPAAGNGSFRVVPATRAAVSLALVVISLALPACAEDDRDSAALEAYGVYRATEDDRNAAEERLRVAFSEIAVADEDRERAAARRAAADGMAAVDEIDRLLIAELESARALTGSERLAPHARRLVGGLEKTREGLTLIRRQLVIAGRDPFLERPGNAREVTSLAVRAADLSVEGELLVRRADRALARELGVEPRSDPFLEEEERGTSGTRPGP